MLHCLWLDNELRKKNLIFDNDRLDSSDENFGMIARKLDTKNETVLNILR